MSEKPTKRFGNQPVLISEYKTSVHYQVITAMPLRGLGVLVTTTERLVGATIMTSSSAFVPGARIEEHKDTGGKAVSRSIVKDGPSQ